MIDLTYHADDLGVYRLRRRRAPLTWLMALASLAVSLEALPVESAELHRFAAPAAGRGELLLVDARGRIAVVDWELAEAHGLPAADLFFFLNYVAGACAAARRPEDVRRAFQAAFFGPDAWTVPYVRRYAEAVQIVRNFVRFGVPVL